jgi:hypothetical protein
MKHVPRLASKPRTFSRDTINDLALQKVIGSLKALLVISSRRLREGNKAFTFGHPSPFGLPT